jgi:hypothetical protein
MIPQTKKDQDLLLKQLDPADAERLSSEFDKEAASTAITNSDELYRLVPVGCFSLTRSFNGTNHQNQSTSNLGTVMLTGYNNHPSAWGYTVNSSQPSPFQPPPTASFSQHHRQAGQLHPSSPFTNTIPRPSHPHTTTVPEEDQNIFIDRKDPMRANNDPTPLHEHYPSTMTKEDLTSSMAKMAATQFASVDQSRLETIFAQALETVSKENEENALRPLLQSFPPQMIYQTRYNSLEMGYQYFAGEGSGFGDGENDNV